MPASRKWKRATRSTLRTASNCGARNKHDRPGLRPGLFSFDDRPDQGVRSANSAPLRVWDICPSLRRCFCILMRRKQRGE